MPLRPADVHADFDELTDLPTMMYFRRYARAYVKSAMRFGRTPYLLYFNLENFSVFNERYGFEEGDKLLGLMAVAIQAAFPGYLLSRFSSDHFLLVCESLNLEAAILEIREQLHAYGRHANVELKVGIYTLEDESVDIGVACDRAKLACDSIAHYHDRVFRWFDAALNWRVERKNYIESHVDQAIKNGWIQVYFQPIVRSVTGAVCEFEALARWDDPRYGMLPPSVFVEILEECRLVHKLDAHIVDTACRIWRQLKAAGTMAVPISVNLSRLDFELCDVFEVVERAVHVHEVPRQMLHIEITESALNEDMGQLFRAITRFRNAGYQVWLDDFGSGYSSLNTLKDYQFDVVKIDMAFLREFDTKPKSRVIIASAVNMAKQLGMQTLIEGVETPEQFDFLRDIGCEFIQGYLVGRPVPPARNLARIEAGELVLENSQLHGYYDRMGGINTLSATPFDFSWDTSEEERPLAEMLPLAIIECEAGHIGFVSSNESFVQVLREVELGTMAQLSERLSSAHTPAMRIMRDVIDAAIASRKIESVDLLENGRHCVMRVRHVASHGNVHCLLISIMNLSRFANVGEDKRLQIALRYLYAVYDEVSIIDLADGNVNTIFRGNALFPSMGSGRQATKTFEEFAQRHIHPDDRARFVNYTNPVTVDRRLEGLEQSYLADAFRVMGSDGMYFWFTCLLVPMLVDDDRTVLVCVRGSNEAVISTMTNQERIPKSLLWDTLLDLVPAGVFWKDAERRFVGVNKNFLEFYNFDSTNDVLGKTDEDMGWHVDDDPFKNYELRVIQTGEPVLNAEGSCISRGEVHEITASKIPLCHNGDVIGLLGYFTERGNEVSRGVILDGFDCMAETDQLTGVPNMRGLVSSISSYQTVYESNGVNFACVVLDIHGMNDFNEVYGRSFGNRILKVVAYRLTRACGVDGVVARIGGDRFAMLHRALDVREAAAFAEQAVHVVEDISEVDGIDLRLRCFVGWSCYSETEDPSEVLALASDRMRRAREAGRNALR